MISIFYNRLVTILIPLVYVANIHSYFAVSYAGIVQRHFYVIAIVLCGISIIMNFRSFIYQTRESMVFIYWCLAFNIVCIFSLFAVTREGYALEKYNEFFWVYIVSLVYLAHVHRQKGAVMLVRIGFLLGTVLLIAVTVWEFGDPEFRLMASLDTSGELKYFVATGEASRIGGLWVNANANGYAIVFGMFASVMLLPSVLKPIFIVLAGIAVLATASRSSIVLWAVSIVALYFLGDLGRRSYKKIFLVTAAIVLLAVAFTSGKVPEIAENFGFEDLFSEDMTERLSSNFFLQEDASAIERKAVVLSAFEGFSQKPMLGNGLGSSFRTGLDFASAVGTHNLFLQLAAEIGIVGVLVFFGGMMLVIVQNRSVGGLALALLFSIANVFSHDLLSQVFIGLLFVLFFVLIPVDKRQAVQMRSKITRSTSKSGKRRRRRRKSSTARVITD